MDAAELARQMREEMPVDEEEPEEGGLMIDETTEFVANLKKPEERDDTPERKARQRSAESPGMKQEDDDGDTAMAGQSYAEVADEEDRQARMKRETSTPADLTNTGLDDEDTMSGQGIAASLNLLRKRGLVNASESDKMAERERARNKFLADKQSLIDEFDQRAREQERHPHQQEHEACSFAAAAAAGGGGCRYC